MELPSLAWNLSPTLSAPGMVLRPLEEDDAVLLSKHLSPEDFAYYPMRPSSVSPEDLKSYNEIRRGSGIHLLLALSPSTHEPLALSSLMDVRQADRGLEIGHTIVMAPWRGTWVNPVLKKLMLAYCFEELKARRVQLKCDARNKRSWQAILKIGAQHEGVLRSNILLPDGTWRNTAHFSILDDEWPIVAERLNILAAERGAPTV